MQKVEPFWSHWGLVKNPFGNIESANDVFESREMGKAMEFVFEAVEEGGIYSISGERGIGKTTVKNEMLTYFEEHGSRYAYSIMECMDLYTVTMSRIMTALVMDLSSEPPRRQSESRKRQVRRILGELASRKRVALVIDEAQKLTINTLESLKLLTEMRWAFRTKLITVILFGQAELNYRLSRDEGLLLRVTPYHMSGLTTDEVLQYIDLRCRTAGGDMREIFEDDVLSYMAENQHSPLHINHVGASTMRAARRAGESKVKSGMVYECAGIRSPRQILRDNRISIKEFARQIHMHDQKVTTLLDGGTEGITEEQGRRFKAGINNLSRGTEEDTDYHEGEKAVG